MFNHITDREKATHNFPGFYRGEVLRNDDPKKAGRVKIRVFSVYDNIAEDTIPWAIMADPMMGGLSNNGGIFVPEVGSHVFVFFEHESHMAPVYFAGAPAIQNGEPDVPKESREEGEYPYNKVFKTKQGITFEVDDTDGAIRFKFKHPSGNESLTDNDGNKTETIVGDNSQTIQGDNTETIEGSMTVEVNKDQTFTVNGNVTIDSSGNMTLTSSGPMTIESSSTVNISGAIVNIN